MTVENERRSAEHYGADFIVVPDSAHNIMMEHNYRETAQKIHQWLLRWRSTAARRNAAYWGTQAASPLEYRRSLDPR